MKDYDGLRTAASSSYGQELFYMLDVTYALRNLGDVSFRPNAKRLSDVAVNPESLKLNSADYGFTKPIRLYPKQDLWLYFLEFAGERTLRAAGIRNFDDLVRIGYNKPNFNNRVSERSLKTRASYGSNPRRPVEDSRDDEDPCIENVRKQREDG